MHPNPKDVVTIDPKLLEDEVIVGEAIKHGDTFADKMEK